MRLPKCKPAWEKHYFKDKNNICTKCGFNYNEFVEEEKKAIAEIDKKLESKGDQNQDIPF